MARVRLTALKQMLTRMRWRSRLRENTALLRETAAAQGSVEEALRVVDRRAASELWPPTSEVMRCAAQVEKLCNQVAALALRRLGVTSKGEDLAARLERLELLVLTAPRLVLPGQRWTTAQEVLPVSLPEVQRVARFTAVLEPLFKRPMLASQRLPFSAAELDELASVWPPGRLALLTLWSRVARIDSAGTLTRFLRRRAGTTPTKPARNGAEVLLTAEFWSNFALARLKELTQARVEPIVPNDAELFEVLRWLLARQSNADARLPSSAVIGEARAGLLELAAELSSFPEKPQHGSSLGDAWWKRLSERAHRAQSGAGQSDYQKLEDNLRLFLRVLQRPDNTPPIYRALATLPHPQANDEAAPQTLVELVARMREKLT